jgi:hypothetical protein
MKERDEIEELFSSAFSDFEKMPPPDIKSAIDEQLFTVPEKRKRKGYIWIMSAIALLIGMFWFGYGYFGDEKENEQQVTSSSAVPGSDNDALSAEKGTNETNVSTNQSDNSSDAAGNEGNISDNPIVSEEAFATQYEAGTSNSIADKPSVQKKNKKTKGTGETSTTPKNDRGEMTPPSSSLKNGQEITNEEHEKGSVDAVNTSSEVASTEDNKKTEKVEDQVPAEEPKDTSETQPDVAQQPTPDQPKAPEKTGKNWSLSLLAGPTYGFSSLDRPNSPEYFMKEDPGFSIGVESSFMLGQRWGITTGLDMNKRTDIFFQEVFDSTYVGQSYEYIYDMQVTDSIVDSILVDVYEYASVNTEQQQRISHFSVALPVYFTLNFPLSQKLGLEVNGGVRISYVSNKLSSNEYSLPTPTFKSVGIRATLRPQVIYALDNGMGIGGYLNTGYDVIPAVQWESIKRSRLDLGGGILLRYSF